MTNSFLRPDEKKIYLPSVQIWGKCVLSIVYAVLPCVLIYGFARKISYWIVVIYVPAVFLCFRILSWIDERSKALEQKLGESREERMRRLRQILGDKRQPR